MQAKISSTDYYKSKKSIYFFEIWVFNYTLTEGTGKQ